LSVGICPVGEVRSKRSPTAVENILVALSGPAVNLAFAAVFALMCAMPPAGDLCLFVAIFAAVQIFYFFLGICGDDGRAVFRSGLVIVKGSR